MVYYCLHKFHWPPSQYLALPRRERATVFACVALLLEEENRQRKDAARKRALNRKR